MDQPALRNQYYNRVVAFKMTRGQDVEARVEEDGSSISLGVSSIALSDEESLSVRFEYLSLIYQASQFYWRRG